MKKYENNTNAPAQGQETTVAEPKAVTEGSTARTGGEPKTPTLEERLYKVEALLMNLQAPSQMQGATTEPSYSEELRIRKAKEDSLRKEAILQKLKAQELEAQKLYPKLSLAQEAKNPDFVALLKSGVDVRSAFEVIHKDEIISASMEYAAREVERMMTNKVLAGGNRPTENGGNHGPAVTKPDVKSMTRQERREMIRRVRMGEKIVL